MVILADTREQNPLEFSHPYVEAVEFGKLDVGDYGCRYRDGYIPPIFFERKGIGDLFGTMTHGYARFKRELERAKDSDVRLILAIEGSFSCVAKGYKHSEYGGMSMVKKLLTLWHKYDLIPVFCSDRVEMAQFIAEYYEAIGKLKGVKHTSN